MQSAVKFQSLLREHFIMVNIHITQWAYQRTASECREYCTEINMQSNANYTSPDQGA